MIYKVTMELEVTENKYPSNYLSDSEIQKGWIQDAIYEQLEDGEDLLFCEVMKKPVTDIKSTGEVV